MKSALPAILVVLIAGLMAVLYFRDDDSVITDVIDVAGPTVRIDDSGNPVLVHREDVAPSTKPALRIRYRLVDASSSKPIVGGRICRSRDGEVLGTTGPDGFVEVEGGRINAVVFAADGYLLEHYFDRGDAARNLAGALRRDGFVRVLLEPDDLTARYRLKFVRVDGRVAEDVQFRVACLDSPAPDGRSFPGVGAGVVSAELRAAWRRHVMLATLNRPDFTGELLHFGRQSQNETFVCDGEADMRFASLGGYRVDARAGDEFRRQSFEVIPGGVVTIQLREGGYVAGQVIGRREQLPVEHAGVSLLYKGSIVISNLTDGDGRFNLGPVAPNSMLMQIHHPAFEMLELRGIRPGGVPVVHQLTELTKNRVHGVVRRRPSLRPVADAHVRLVSGDGLVAEARTDGLGRFDLRSYLIEPTLEIEAKGFLVYGESLNANGISRMFDLIPASVDERVRTRMTSLVSGSVFDEKGKPAPNRPVHAQPLNPHPPQQFDGRRIQRGGRLQDPTTVITDADGKFALEWPRSEAIRVHAVKGIAKPDDGTVVTAILGRRHQVVLRDPR